MNTTTKKRVRSLNNTSSRTQENIKRTKNVRSPVQYNMKNLKDNVLYKVENTSYLNFILYRFKNIKCSAFEIENNKIITNDYFKLFLQFQDFQTETYDYYDKPTGLLDFLCFGVNTETNENKTVFDSTYMEHVFFVKNDKAKYTRLFVFKHKAPKYYENIENKDQYDAQERKEIEYEYALLEERFPVKYEFPLSFKTYMENNRHGPVSNSFYKSLSPLSNMSSSFTAGNNDESRLKKYKRFLKKQNLQKLQTMAKNKNVKYHKKINGNMVMIKKDSLIRKLSKHYINSMNSKNSRIRSTRKK